LLRAALLVFTLFLAYRFLAQVAALALLLSVGLLLAVALSAPVEALYHRKVPRPVGVVVIVLVLLAALGVAGYFLYPTLAKQVSQLASSLPDAFSQLLDRARGLANRFGVKIGGGGGGISPQTLAKAVRRVLGGLVGLFGGIASFFTGRGIVKSCGLAPEVTRRPSPDFLLTVLH
jgi:predicted PurR-regulated permease PerM